MRRFGSFLSVLILIFILDEIAPSQFAGLPSYRFPPGLTKRDKELTALDPADRIRFADFLKKDETGFVRLHDAANCTGKALVINTNEPCPWNVPGKATSYSFRKEKYRNAFFSDLALFDSKFQIVGINSLGFLTELGDVALEKLSLQTGGIKQLSEFVPSSDLKEIEKQYSATKKGFRVGNFLYMNALPVKENVAYALRCIAYKSKVYRRVNGFKVNLLDGDKRVDVTLVFRVIRKHDDGSVSILWKQLNEKDAPKLVFAEPEKK